MRLTKRFAKLNWQRSKKPKRVTKSGGRIFVRMPSFSQSAVPSPIFVAAMIGVEKLFRIDLDP